MKQVLICCKTKCQQSPEVPDDDMGESGNIKHQNEEKTDSEMQGMSIYMYLFLPFKTAGKTKKIQ